MNRSASAKTSSASSTPASVEASLDAALEEICGKGCRQVNQDIARLERGELLPEVSGLSHHERRRLLEELRAIMAVYGERCPLDDPRSTN